MRLVKVEPRDRRLPGVEDRRVLVRRIKSEMARSLDSQGGMLVSRRNCHEGLGAITL